MGWNGAKAVQNGCKRSKEGFCIKKSFSILKGINLNAFHVAKMGSENENAWNLCRKQWVLGRKIIIYIWCLKAQHKREGPNWSWKKGGHFTPLCMNFSSGTFAVSKRACHKKRTVESWRVLQNLFPKIAFFPDLPKWSGRDIKNYGERKLRWGKRNWWEDDPRNKGIFLSSYPTLTPTFRDFAFFLLLGGSMILTPH